jgi:outer membrane protein TolC
MDSLTADENRALAAMDVADASYATAWWSQMPDFTLGYAWKQFDAPTDTGTRPWYGIVALSVTVPILFPIHEATDAKRARSQAMLDRSDATLQKLQLDSARVEAVRTFLRSREYLKELRQRDLPLGQALLESAYSAYRGGQLGYADMVLSRKTLIDLRLREIEMRSSLVSARLRCLSACEAGPTSEGKHQ